ncbi:MAG: CPBP family intramembrane glutamic endopeptidase [Cytophagales bacterium]|nr:CPBP family intramembrane glutamic endopeptidase [Cytophagales bacterium]
MATTLMVVLGFFLNASHLKPLSVIDTFSDAPLRLTLGIVMPFLTAALPEEFFFRGYLQTRLEKNGTGVQQSYSLRYCLLRGIFQVDSYFRRE